MLVPNIGPEYIDERYRGLVMKMEQDYAASVTMNQAFWGEADTDFRFIAGDQTVWSDYYGNLPIHQRKNFNFNRIRRIVQMVSGYQRRNRKSTICVPIENADQKTADQFTQILMWANRDQQILETISEAFYGALVGGMNLLQVWMDYRQDPVSGTIRVDNCSYNSYLIDPFFRKADLSDCNFIWKRSYLQKREVLSLLPSCADEIMAMNGQQNRDGRFQFMPENYNSQFTNLLTYDEYYYRDYRTQRMLVDKQTGESLEWKSDNEEALRYYLQLYPQIEVITQEIPTVKLGILVNDKVMWHGPNPMGTDSYPFIPVMAYYEPQIPYFPYRIQGMVRGLRDSQYLYNRRKVIELDILESQINSGWKYKENALVNPADVFLSGQGKGLALKEEAQMADVERIQPAQVPPSMIELSRILGQEIQEISGVNEELLGSATDDKAGVLSMLRQGAGLTTLQNLFDQLDRSQKLLGKIMIELVQNNFTPGKVQRIVNEAPAPSFYSKFFGRYDAAIEEGFNTTTQKQMEFAQLTKLKEMGIPVPHNFAIGAATIQNKDALIKAVMEQEEQMAKMQQMQAEAAIQELQSRTELSHARAVADQGLGMERVSRIAENQALASERKAEAVKDRELGMLHLVKAMKELEGLDLQQLEQVIRLNSIMRQEAESSAPNPVQTEQGV